MKISIVIANYNNAPYVEKSIGSVVAQTSSDWELIICDDCSTDNSIERMKPFLRDSRMTLLRNPQNLGLVKTLERMIEMAAHEVIGILDSDDALTGTAVEDVLKAYEQNPACGFTYSLYELCDHKLRPFGIAPTRQIPEGKCAMHLPVISHFKTFRRSAYMVTEGLDDSMLYAEDKDLIYKLEEVCQIVFINRVLYQYRFLKNSQSHDPKKREIGVQSHIRALCNAYKRRSYSHFVNLTKEEITAAIIKYNNPSDIYPLLHRVLPATVRNQEAAVA